MSALPNRTLALPSRDNVVNFQVNTLLQIAGCLGAFVANTRTDNDNIPQGGANDGGARMSAELTFSKVCARLDAIVDDASRWNMEIQDTLEKTLLVAYHENIEAIRAAIIAAKSQAAPSTRFKPTLIFLPKLGWCAILGDMNALEHCVVGYGATPEQAMLSFDVNFEAGPPDAAAILAFAREKAFEEGTEAPVAMTLPTKPKRKKK